VNGQRFLVCSGTLISRTVFLTAAHCTSYLQSLGARAYVSFDTHITAKSTLYAGTMFTNPGYNQTQAEPGDVAVVVLDKAARGITPAALPSLA
jgi:V8-like Glu-specific endopeptidase